MLGTPGYLPPEQVASPQVGPAADIYALGATLFEILANEPLHPRGHDAIAATLTSRVHVLPFVLAYHGFLVLIGRVFGPWVFIPALVAVSSIAITALPELIERIWITLALALTALLAPFLLEAAGVFSPTWSLQQGALVARSAMFELDGRVAVAFILLAHVALIVVNTALARQLARSRRDAHHRAAMQARHLRKLVLEAVPPVV